MCLCPHDLYLDYSYSICISACYTFECRGVATSQYDATAVKLCAPKDISYLSYISTCTAIVPYWNAFNGQHFRVYYVPNADYVIAQYNSTYTGRIADVVNEIATLSGVVLNEIPISDTYIQMAKDSNDGDLSWACIYAVQGGAMDLCVTYLRYTETSMLVDQVSYTNPFYTSVLVAYLNLQVSVVQTLMKIIQPMDLKVWLIVIIIVVSSSVAFTYMRGKESKGYLMNIYNGLLSMMGGAYNMNENKLSSSVFSYGFGFFCMIFLATYCANLSSFLSMGGGTDYSNIGDVYKAKMPICTLDSYVSIINAKYLSKAFPNDQVSLLWETFLNFNDKTCMVYVDEFSVRLDQYAEQQGECASYSVLPAILSTFNIGLPINPAHVAFWNYWIAVLKQTKFVERVTYKYDNTQPKCSKSLESVDSEDVSFSLIQLGFVLVGSGVLFALFLVVFWVEDRQSKSVEYSHSEYFRTMRGVYDEIKSNIWVVTQDDLQGNLYNEVELAKELLDYTDSKISINKAEDYEYNVIDNDYKAEADKIQQENLKHENLVSKFFNHANNTTNDYNDYDIYDKTSKVYKIK